MRRGIFSNLRWQLTFWFVVLTMLVYIISALFGCWIFRAAMTHLVDDELSALADELIPAIYVIDDDRPSLESWAKIMQQHPYRSLPTIQLYDKNGNLLEVHGPRGVPILFSRFKNAKKDIKEESYHIRVHDVPLYKKNELIGYLQLELALKNVDGAIHQFGLTLTLIAPFLLLGFGLAGYVFSSKAAKPVEESFHILQRFFADAGHELSTPISIIVANAESMEENLQESKDIQDKLFLKNCLATIMRSTERMNKVVSDLLWLAKAESPHIHAQKKWLELDKIVLATMADFSELFKNKGIALQAGTIDTVLLYGHEESIKRLINNLLQNSLKYTEEGAVKVSLTNLGRQARLTISDSGIGIPAESLPHIFERFYRVEPSRSRQAGGSGLGLSIAKAIVDAHRGKITVESTRVKNEMPEHPSSGTTLSITLPLSKSDFRL